MTLHNAHALMKARKAETVIALQDLLDCVEYWNALMTDIENSKLVDFHRVSILSHTATRAIYTLDIQGEQCRKLSLDTEVPPSLTSIKDYKPRGARKSVSLA